MFKQIDTFSALKPYQRSALTLLYHLTYFHLQQQNLHKAQLSLSKLKQLNTDEQNVLAHCHQVFLENCLMIVYNQNKTTAHQTIKQLLDNCRLLNLPDLHQEYSERYDNIIKIYG